MTTEFNDVWPNPQLQSTPNGATERNRYTAYKW